MSQSSNVSRDELVELILANNMLEKFVQWLQQKGVDIDPISLRDVDVEYLYQFALEKKLLVTESEEFAASVNEDEEVKVLEKKAQRHTKPKKIRRKT